MDGSRHERVALIGATYVIGFVTAFIAFGVTQLEDAVEFVYIPTTTQSAALIAATPSASAASIELMNDGLYYKAGTSEILIASITDGSGEDGIAAAIVQYELSPDGAWVYFCEQPSADSDSCKPFVYSVQNDVVVPLTQAGERIALPNKESALVWGKTGVSIIGDITIDALPAL
jgi:hypothetical protein